MVQIKYSIFVIFFAFIIQGVYSFCVYNHLTDGTTFEVYQAHSRVPSGRGFAKTISPDGKECCPYTTNDCSYRRVNSDPSDFNFYFNWPRYKSLKYLVQCKTGGAVSIYGEEQNHYAVCTDADGNAKRVPIIPDAVKS